MKVHHRGQFHRGYGHVGGSVHITHGVPCLGVVAESTPFMRIGHAESDSEIRHVIEHLFIMGVHYGKVCGVETKIGSHFCRVEVDGGEGHSIVDPDHGIVVYLFGRIYRNRVQVFRSKHEGICLRMHCGGTDEQGQGYNQFFHCLNRALMSISCSTSALGGISIKSLSPTEKNRTASG